MADVVAVAIVQVEADDGGFVKGNGHDEWLPGVPQQGERLSDEATGEDPGGGSVQRFRRHSLRGLAVRQVAVAAIDIAERRRLQDKQLERARTNRGVDHVLTLSKRQGPSIIAEAAVDEAAVPEAAAAAVGEAASS